MDLYINHWAVVTAAVSDLVLGAVWYSPLLFYRTWMNANGFTDDTLPKASPVRIYGLTLIFAVAISYNLAFFLGEPSTTATWGLIAGTLAGAWAALGLWTISQFERRSLKYILVNGGYLLIAFALKGLIIGAWR